MNFLKIAAAENSRRSSAEVNCFRATAAAAQSPLKFDALQIVIYIQPPRRFTVEGAVGAAIRAKWHMDVEP